MLPIYSYESNSWPHTKTLYYLERHWILSLTLSLSLFVSLLFFCLTLPLSLSLSLVLISYLYIPLFNFLFYTEYPVYYPHPTNAVHFFLYCLPLFPLYSHNHGNNAYNLYPSLSCFHFFLPLSNYQSRFCPFSYIFYSSITRIQHRAQYMYLHSLRDPPNTTVKKNREARTTVTGSALRVCCFLGWLD